MSRCRSNRQNVMSGFDSERIARLNDVLAGHVADDTVGGVAWLAARGDDVRVGVVGNLTRGTNDLVRRDSIFRIASMTKPIVAVAALILVEECRLRLEDPVDDVLPELAGRRVLVDPRGPIDGPTVDAHRPITVHDVLTFQLGLGMDFAAPWPQPLIEAMGSLDLADGPPAPQVPPAPDEWMRRLGTLPLLYQPGERWLYNTGSDVLGVLVARVAGKPLDVFLRERVSAPLGMADTDFATTNVDRLSTCYISNPESGETEVYDAPDGQWSRPPAFPSGGGGLVSTLDDMYAFGRMLLSGGRLLDGSWLLSRASVEAMTTDHIGAAAGAPGPAPDGSQGWGFGVGVQVRRTGLVPTIGTYGWAGGLGTSWANDPTEGIVGVVLTTDAFASAYPAPATIRDFWTCVYASIAD
jgi:CubicO group peptidase (beta-lactamase class C family)